MLVEAKSNYVKVGVWRKPGQSACGLDALHVESEYNAPWSPEPCCFVGYNDPERERVDSYIWPFSSNEQAAAAFESARAVCAEAKRRGHAAEISVYRTAPPPLDRVAVVLLRELGDEYDD